MTRRSVITLACLGTLLLAAAASAEEGFSPPPEPRTAPDTLRHLELMVFSRPLVTVASQHEEPLREAPVITSVVTAEEIRRMGARTLNDVLLTLPGFSHVQDHNEYYAAFRGIYGSSQQKILVLRDGHRLNSRSYSEANFDYAISLDNVERIEVLRGPGGSLYGDVALTAVVNIVTRSGEDIDGWETTAGAGSWGQRRFSLVAGKRLGPGESLTLSAAGFKADGEPKSWPDPRRPDDEGSSIVYGFDDDKPTLPRHWRCRCVYLPALPSWREVGLDADEFTSTRPAMNPPICAHQAIPAPAPSPAAFRN